MIQSEKVLYCPALRMKEGELNGLRELASDVAAHVIPRFIVPPLGERDEKQFGLFAPGKVPDIGGILAKVWFGRRAFIDLSYLLDEAGRTEAITWLPDIFGRARGMQLRAIPMAKLSDMNAHEIPAFKASIAGADKLKFALCVASGDLVRADFGTDIKSALAAVGLEASDCAVIADFSDADFSDPDPVAPIIGGALEQLQTLGNWQHIIFQGTYYPESNPADPGQGMLCPRNEWLAWRQAVNFDPTTADHLIFGDYAADSSKMVFGSKGGRPIPHYRYTTATSWLIERGKASGGYLEVMQDVCKRVVNSGHFAGAVFSHADLLIYRTAPRTASKVQAMRRHGGKLTLHITLLVL